MAKSSAQRPWLDKFLEKQTHLTEKTGEVYLASGGYYQTEYIAIFENLTSSSEDDYAKHMANELNVNIIAELFIKELIVAFPDKKLPFNKILSVTLPSQMIAKSIEEKLEKNESGLSFYQHAGDGQETYGLQVPKLIRLASYYSFADEIQFKNVVPGDRILIVNDVISTGRLLDQIYTSISALEDAKISRVMAVVDSRVRLEEHENKTYQPSIFFRHKNFNEKEHIISLRSHKIRKYLDNPFPAKTPIRINPILNSRITMDSRINQEEKIIYKNADDFLSKTVDKSLKIGHFAQNSLHHTYFITPDDLFQKDEFDVNPGINLLGSVVSAVDQIELQNDIGYYVKSVVNQLDTMKSLLDGMQMPVSDRFSNKKEQFEEYLKHTEQAVLKSIPKRKKQIQRFKENDFVFYPIFSGIEKINQWSIQEIFKVDYSNIIPLQRFDTNKGWRFIIPQKSYNERLKGKSATIIDMGAFTGDSIIQMIDALCVFELRKITVISMVGRLEDFDREFFSRIQEMRVKMLNRNILFPEADGNRLAPVKIYFGVNLHIPASLSSKVCEHCNEIALLKKEKEIEIFIQTPAKNYIEKRLDQLELAHVSNIVNQCPVYFPKQRDGSYDVKTFFSIRNHLGKIDGYRFYIDYYYFFDELSPESLEYTKNLEGIMAICLHENHLLKTIENQLPDVKRKISEYIDDVIIGFKGMDDLYYDWPLLSILQLYFLVNDGNEGKIYDVGRLYSIFDFIISNNKNDNDCFDYLAYRFASNYHTAREGYNKNGKSFTQTVLMRAIKDIWSEIEAEKNLRYHSLITHFNRKIVNEEMINGKKEVAGFFHLFKTYDVASAYYPNHSDFAVAINNLKTSINRISANKSIDKEADIENFKKEMEETEKKLRDIESSLDLVHKYLINLTRLLKGDTFVSEFISGERSIQGFLDKIYGYLSKKQSSIEDRFDLIWNSVLQMERDYFVLTDADNFYSLWKTANYTSVQRIWKCFVDKKEAENMSLFHRFMKDRAYPDRIENELKLFDISVTKKYRDVGVSIHPYLLIFIFKELIDNTLRYAKKSVVKVSLTTEMDAESGSSYTIIRYRQNVPAKGDPANGLVEVERILRDFNGKWDYKRRDNSLLIKIGLPVTKYKFK